MQLSDYSQIIWLMQDAGTLRYGSRQCRPTERLRYDFTLQLASFAPPTPEQMALFAALTCNQAAADRFFGALTGSVPMEEFFAPGNLIRILGLGGFARVALRRMGQRSRRQHPSEQVAS